MQTDEDVSKIALNQWGSHSVSAADDATYVKKIHSLETSFKCSTLVEVIPCNLSKSFDKTFPISLLCKY